MEAEKVAKFLKLSLHRNLPHNNSRKQYMDEDKLCRHYVVLNIKEAEDSSTTITRDAVATVPYTKKITRKRSLDPTESKKAQKG